MCDVGLMEPAIVILAYACAIREEEMYWWNKSLLELVIQVVQVVNWSVEFLNKKQLSKEGCDLSDYLFIYFLMQKDD